MFWSFLIFISWLTWKVIAWWVVLTIIWLFLKWQFKSWRNFEQEMRDWETILIRNIWILCIFLIMIFIGLLAWNWLWDKAIFSNEYLVNWIGLIVAFWYWYKRYERDKETDALISYSKEYAAAVNQIPEKWIWGLLNIWYTQYCLYKKWYLKEDFWIELEFWIKKDLLDILLAEHDTFAMDREAYSSEEYKKVIDYLVYSDTLLVFDLQRITIANQFLVYLRTVIQEVLTSIKIIRKDHKNNINTWFEFYTK